MMKISMNRGILKHGNPAGDPSTAPRCGRGRGTVGRVARLRCKTPKRAATRAAECTGGVPLDPERGRVWSDAARRDGSTGAARRRQLQATSDEQQKGAKFTRSFVTWSSCSSAPRFSSLCTGSFVVCWPKSYTVFGKHPERWGAQRPKMESPSSP
jgi:hypothetical protein